MRREIAIAKPKPRLVIEALERRERVERLALETPFLRAIHYPRERIGDRVDIRRDVQPVELFVVARVDDDGQPRRIDSTNESAEELSRTHSPRKRGYLTGRERSRLAARHWVPFFRRASCRAWSVRPRRGPSRAPFPRTRRPARTRPSRRPPAP